VFRASVNDPNFLVDTTGNTRFWVIAIDKADFNHGLDMQQLFAQLALDYQAGKQWWLMQEEEQYLEEYNLRHRSISAVAEKVLSELDLDRKDAPNLPAMTATEVLKEVGIEHPSNQQCKEAVGILRECLGESKRIRGLEKWRIPLKQSTWSPSKPLDDDEY
jgi:putative DNA primase/helicase